MHRFARDRERLRGKEVSSSVSSASTMCLNASMGPSPDVRRRWTSFLTLAGNTQPKVHFEL